MSIRIRNIVLGYKKAIMKSRSMMLFVELHDKPFLLLDAITI